MPRWVDDSVRPCWVIEEGSRPKPCDAMLACEEASIGSDLDETGPRQVDQRDWSRRGHQRQGSLLKLSRREKPARPLAKGLDERALGVLTDVQHSISRFGIIEPTTAGPAKGDRFAVGSMTTEPGWSHDARRQKTLHKVGRWPRMRPWILPPCWSGGAMLAEHLGGQAYPV